MTPYAYDFDWMIRRALIQRWRPFLKPQGASLEVGCYMGDMTGLLLEELGQLDVAEMNSEWAQAVAERHGDKVNITVGKIEDLVTGKRYDQIFLVHTLEHIDNPVEVLQALRELLTPTGHLFVAVPNALALSRQIAVAMGLISHCEAVTEAEKVHGHWRTYTQQTLNADLEAAGLVSRAQGGVILKTLSNAQFDRALADNIVSKEYVAACDQLSLTYPEMGASVYSVCSGA
jgi:2-polyprenyl-3-methyl-5-hydroxy-6-metoxy-1,4-benzoquinol methylase